MKVEFRRDYQARLPLPLAQLYSRAYNAKDARGRHDNAFYLFEAIIKLAAAPAIAAYLQEVEHGASRVQALDRLLAQLALPSLGQWLAILRALARHFGDRPDAAAHPLGHLARQLNQAHRDQPGILALYVRIKNGPDGEPSGDTSCSLMQLFDALVQYRNGVFGHGGARFSSFYEETLGPLLFPAINEALAEDVFDLLGPRGTRLVYITELRTLDERRVELGLRELVGFQGERAAPMVLETEQSAKLLPNRVAVLWPGRGTPLRLDPILLYRESELADEMLFLNRDRNGKQVEYLSYTTGRTERDRAAGPALAALLSRITNRQISETDLDDLAGQSLAETPSVEALFGAAKPAGTQMGDYEMLGELGRGGMGVVFLARQMSLGRLVALKMLPADLAGNDGALTRFRREIRHLARCEHPNIIKVLSSGIFPDGQIYYTMEYVPGSDLEMVWRELAGPQHKASISSLGNFTWAQAVLSASRKRRAKAERSRSGATPNPSDQEAAKSTETDGAELSREKIPDSSQGALNLRLALPPLPELPNVADDPGGYIRRVVTLMRDAALGLQAVHEQGIVHRDIKPANLMLTPDSSRVVLMDFGQAKGQSLTLAVSRAGGFLGTLRYAAPEQMASATMKVGPQADIRALGVTLWELLTRERLFGDSEVERQLAHRVQNEDVPRLRSIDPSFDRDLQAIVARATERNSADRIQSAAQLAEYLQLFLDGRPLPIRPPGSTELARRWIREHRGLVFSTGAGALVVLIAVAWAFISIAAANNRMEQQLYMAHIGVAERELTSNHDFGFADDMLQSCPERLRGWEWRYLKRREDGERVPLEGHQRGLWMADFSPDGKQIATASIDGTVKLWDADSGRMLRDIDAQPAPVLPISLPPFFSISKAMGEFGIPRIPITCVAFSPDGEQFASGSFAPKIDFSLTSGIAPNLQESQGVVTLWNAHTGEKSAEFREQFGVVLSLAFRRDGRQIASSTINPDNTFVVWDAKTCKVVRVVRGHRSSVHRLRYSPDGRFLASGDTEGMVKLWDASTLQLVRSIDAHNAPVVDVAFAPDSLRLATASDDGTVKVWETETGKNIRVLKGHTGAALGVAFSLDGTLIASGGFDKTVRVWDAQTGIERIALRGHKDIVWSVAFSPDGQRLISASFDKTARVWDATPAEEPRGPGVFTVVGHTDRVNGVAFSPDDKYLASSSWDRDIRLWDAKTGAAIRTLKGHTASVWGIAFNRDSTQIASASWDRSVKIWDVSNGRLLHTLPGHTAPAHCVSFSPDGKRLASGGFDGQVKIWDVATEKLIANCDGLIFPVLAVAFSPDGKRVASGGADRNVKLWDAGTGKIISTLKGHEAAVYGLAFTPDGKRLVSASWDKTLKIWDVDPERMGTAREQAPVTLTGHEDRVNSVAISPDGSRIASASEDKTVRLWDAKTGEELIAPLHHRAVVWSVVFSPDGKRLATGCWSKSGWVKTWTLDDKPLLKTSLASRPP